MSDLNSLNHNLIDKNIGNTGTDRARKLYIEMSKTHPQYKFIVKTPTNIIFSTFGIKLINGTVFSISCESPDIFETWILTENNELRNNLGYGGLKYFGTITEIHKEIARVTNILKPKLLLATKKIYPSISYRYVTHSDCQY
jgi:hypothetical protein